MTDPLIEQLCRHEGFSKTPYLCTAGFQTCGYGYNLIANPLRLSAFELAGYRRTGMTRPQALALLIRQVAELRTTLAGKLPVWTKLNGARQDALCNMALNLGVKGLLNFKRTLSFLELGEHQQAAEEMLQSKWAGQVKGRAIELSRQIATGRYA
ncbi:MAG: glycoside hydrolase family protein [Candidatus Moranbacteria bacterium]|nr:glycoside hydrolase family protein [Candidatus Moranbacteria bacterium]